MEKAKYIYYSLLAAVLISLPSLANTSNGNEFHGLYDKMISYITGLPGIMFAVAVLIFSIYMSFFAGKGPLFFFGGVITAAAIFLIPAIANGMGAALF